jgi:cytoskeletal protein RodZ
MKKLLILALISYSISCKEKKEEPAATSAATTSTTPAAPAAPTAVTPASGTQPAASALPGPNKTSITVKGSTVAINGTLISTLTYKDDKGAGVKEDFYIQKDQDKLTLTQIQAMSGEAEGISKSVYEIDLKNLHAAALNVEEVKDKKYTNGVMYLINLECNKGANCMSHSYEDIGMGKPTNRTETLTQIAFADKANADKYLDAIKNSLK